MSDPAAHPLQTREHNGYVLNMSENKQKRERGDALLKDAALQGLL